MHGIRQINVHSHVHWGNESLYERLKTQNDEAVPFPVWMHFWGQNVIKNRPHNFSTTLQIFCVAEIFTLFTFYNQNTKHYPISNHIKFYLDRANLYHYHIVKIHLFLESLKPGQWLYTYFIVQKSLLKPNNCYAS